MTLIVHALKLFIRPYPFSWTVAVLTLVFDCMAIVGCAGPLNYARAINESPGRYVRLEAHYGHRQDGVAMPFAHPMTLSETEWARLLNGLYVQPRKKFLTVGSAQVDPDLAFNEPDRRYLAKYVAEAFMKARPDEWVVFYIGQSREDKVTDVTSGGFFVEGGLLHLVIANYLQPVAMSFIQQAIWNDPLRSVGDSFYDFVPQHDQTLQTEWQWGQTKYLLNQVSELVIDYRASLSLSDETGATSGSRQSEGRIGHGEGIQLEETLRELKRLREQGLISDDEYQLRLKKLVDEL